MDKGLSNKFKWLAFVATWAVVCIHSHTNNWLPEVDDYGNSVQIACLDFFHFAVPLFFVISGYFFVNSYEKYGWGQLLRRKIRTLYVPMVIWTTLALIILLPIRLYSGNDIPDFISFIGIPLMMTEHCRSVHFWYVRALLVLFCLGPLLYAVVRRWYIAVAVMVLALAVPGNSWLAHKHVPVAVFYFICGALISFNGCNLLTRVSKISGGGGADFRRFGVPCEADWNVTCLLFRGIYSTSIDDYVYVDCV